MDVLLVEDLSQQRLPARTLAAVLQRAGLRAQVVHFGPDQGAGEIVALAQRARPRLMVFSILFADRMSEHLALITALRQAGVRAHLTLIGPLPSSAPVELLAACPALDSVLCGDAEATVAQLATRLFQKEEDSLSRQAETLRRYAAQGDSDIARWQVMPGLAYRSPELRVNPLPKPPPDLDDLPFPARDDGIPTRLGYGFATVEGSRGCYHACTFCLPCAFYRANGSPYRVRSVANLVDEIEALYHQGTRLFLFDDEQFLPPRRARDKRVAALRHELERRSLRIAFTIKCRADDVTDPRQGIDVALFRCLKEMGLLRVYVGIESGCQATLDLLGKGITVQRNAEALAALDELDIVADFRSLLFHPWSTLETVQADVAFLQSVMPHLSTCFNFQEVEVYPGTPMAARLRAEGRGEGDPWPLPYIIADPRVELLRRLSRLVFSPSGLHARFQELITQSWFDLLLLRHFEPERFDADRARQLKAMVARANGESLDVWREMLAFAREGDIYDVDRVNEHASVWAGRIHSVCAAIQVAGNWTLASPRYGGQ